MAEATQSTVKPGDRARLIKLPDITDPELRELFERCLGHVFPVRDTASMVWSILIGELSGEKSYSIYVEQDCVEVVSND